MWFIVTGALCFVGGALFGWRMGYGAGYVDGQLDSLDQRRYFQPWPWQGRD